MVAAVLLLAATVLALTTCSDDDSDESTPTSETTSTTQSVEDEVEAAYLAFWEMFVRVAQAPDPDDPEIAQRASGEARENVINGLGSMRSLGQRSVFGADYAHEVLTVDLQGESRAVLEDCAVDDSRLVNAATGETIRAAIVTEHVRAVLVHDGDGWLVDETSRLGSWDGKVACS